MEEIIKLGRTDTMTSLEIAEITGKLHKHIMEAIRKNGGCLGENQRVEI